MIAALTGTPGTGKTTVGRALAQAGFDVLDLGELIVRKGLYEDVDPARDSKVVDPRTLSRFLQPELRQARQARRDLVLEGHLAHEVHGVEVAVVLRCRPAQLAERLRARGWPEAKVRENCQAEALDMLTVEAAEAAPRVLEVDTTGKAPDAVAREVVALLRSTDAEAWNAHRPGSVSWGEEVLEWS